MATLKQQLEDRQRKSECAFNVSDDDGLIAALAKLFFGLGLWKLVYSRSMPEILRFWGGVDRVVSSVPAAEAIIRRAIDVYTFVWTFVMLVTYVVTFYSARRIWEIPVTFAWLPMGTCVLTGVFRLCEILSVFAELHLSNRYSTRDRVRAVLSTFWV